MSPGATHQVNTTQEVRGSADEPVFVDGSGRRRRTLRRLGWVLGVACACYAVVLAVSLAGGNSTAPWLPITGQADKGPDKVTVESEPDEDEDAPAAPETPVDATPVANPAELPAVPGTDATDPVVPDADDDPASPRPTASADGETPEPDTSPSADASKSPTADAGGTGAEPPTTQEPPIDLPEPSESQVGEETETGEGE